MVNTWGLEWPGEDGDCWSRTDMMTGLMRAKGEVATACVCMRRYGARGAKTKGHDRIYNRERLPSQKGDGYKFP